MSKKSLFILFLICLSIILVGCWDMEEINQRIFVSSIGIDFNEEGKEGEGNYIVTYVYPNIYALGKEPTQKEERFVVSTVSQTLFDSSRHLATRIDKPFYFKHLKVIVIGEEFLKHEDLVKQVLDGLNRDSRINRNVKIAVTDGTAKEILEIKPKQEPITGAYLNDVIENNSQSSRFTPQTLTRLTKEFDISDVTLAPKVKKVKDDLVISGAAILRDYKLIGWIGEEENRTLAMMKSKVKTELIDVSVEDFTVSYVITGVKAKNDVSLEDEKIKASFDIHTEGYIQQYTFEGGKNTFQDDFIEKVEREVEKKLKEEAEKLVHHMQTYHKADIFGIGEYLSKHHPKVWEDVGKDWDEIFVTVDFEINVTSKVRRTGVTK
ncbi:MAG TPA: Ger(x)C family spore germination protein [Tissierellales bacterium]|nr:Ger(x)C family spore germination protein [Tissierellales bacterium]